MLPFPFPNYICRDFCGETFELQQWLLQSKDACLFNHSTIFLVLSNMLSIGKNLFNSETCFIIKTICWHIMCVRESKGGRERSVCIHWHVCATVYMWWRSEDILGVGSLFSPCLEAGYLLFCWFPCCELQTSWTPV